MTENTNIWLDGIMGVVAGDALGCPVQFESREEVSRHPVTGMRGYGTFHLPEGSWTDDSSLTLALLESIRRLKRIDPDDIMENFMKWLYDGDFTPYGEAYDIGRGTMQAIGRYKRNRKWKKCGGDEEWNNGNGSLMRILPACIYCSEMLRSGKYAVSDAIKTIHAVGGLTHAHIRSNIACGLYFFMADQILTDSSSPQDCLPDSSRDALQGTSQASHQASPRNPLQSSLQTGLNRGFTFYESYLADKENLHCYDRLRNLDSFAALPSDRIKSSGYVVDALEAAVWSLITTDTFDQALLKAVNLGYDTDTTAAIAGGLAGLYYGYGAVPADWLKAVKRREWIEEMCRDILL